MMRGMLVLFVGAALAAAPQPFAKTETGPGGATLTLRLDRTATALADEITLTLEVQGPTPVEVEKVAPLTPARSWLVSAGEPELVPLAGDRTRWRQEFRLAALQAGAVTLPLLPLHYRVGSGDTQEYTWPAVTVQVTTTVLRPQLSEARENTPPDLELPPPPLDPWPALAVVALVGIVGVVGWRIARGWKPTERQWTAEETALADLDQLLACDLPAVGQVDPFHVALADILRRYLERKLGLPVASRSTQELLTSLEASGRLPVGLQEELRTLFDRCDLAKFARVAFGPAECRLTADQARSWVTQAAAQLLPPPVVVSGQAAPGGAAS